ncbi:MAG: M28 family peptidase [Nitrospinae bacterium]|nr:M28 family peptidase [Nitrospinota bacterium]
MGFRLLKIKLVIIYSLLVIITGCTQMQYFNESFSEGFKELNNEEITSLQNLKKHIMLLAGTLGQRNMYFPKQLESAAAYIDKNFRAQGHKVGSHEYTVQRGWRPFPSQFTGKVVSNIEAEIPGEVYRDEIILVGAHYDSVVGSPGANDNATGVAGLLEIGRLLSGRKLKRTIRLVAFVNEESPFFATKNMGSYVYAQRCSERQENIRAMISLETLGYYSNVKGSQTYPFPLGFFKPGTGNYLGFVSNIRSRHFLKDFMKRFGEMVEFPMEGVAIPQIIPGIGWSDHRSFWKFDYPAIMVTDTALFRYPFYHTHEDTPEKIHYHHLARVVSGLLKSIETLANEPSPLNY